MSVHSLDVDSERHAIEDERAYESEHAAPLVEEKDQSKRITVASSRSGNSRMLRGAVDGSSGQAKEGRHRAENDEGLALLDGVLVQVKEGELGGCCSVLVSLGVDIKGLIETLTVSNAVEVRSESSQRRFLRSQEKSSVSEAAATEFLFREMDSPSVHHLSQVSGS